MPTKYVRRLLMVGFIGGSFVGSIATGVTASLLGSDIFDDVDQGSFYDAAVGELSNDGIIKGYNARTFGPNDYVTRGQVAVMFQRFKDAYIDGDVPASSSRSSRRSDDDSSSSSSRSSSSSVSSAYNPKGSFRFTTTNYSVNETQSLATVSVVRVGGNEGTVTVNYAVTSGTATSGSDFSAVNGTLTFGNDETSKTFTVSILNDTNSEGSETATLTLSSPANGAGITTPNTATITIVDDESPTSTSSTASSSSSVNPKGSISLGAYTYGVNENEGSITITVLRQGGSTGEVAINYATSNGSGTAGTEYTATNGTLTFAAGETSKTFTVSVADDTSVDGSQTFTVTLSSPTNGASLTTPSSASVAINDNENDAATWGSGAVKFSRATYDVSEGVGNAEVIVQRTSGTQGTITVNYATTSVTALSGPDFTATNGSLTFGPGEASKVLRIPIIKDSTAESDEYFYVDLSGNATFITPYTTQVNIVN